MIDFPSLDGEDGAKKSVFCSHNPATLIHALDRTTDRWNLVAALDGVSGDDWIALGDLVDPAAHPRWATGRCCRIQHLEAVGIDPSAIFYSEIDAMPAIEEQLREQRSGDDDPLW